MTRQKQEQQVVRAVEDVIEPHLDKRRTPPDASADRASPAPGSPDELERALRSARRQKRTRSSPRYAEPAHTGRIGKRGPVRVDRVLEPDVQHRLVPMSAVSFTSGAIRL